MRQAPRPIGVEQVALGIGVAHEIGRRTRMQRAFDAIGLIAFAAHPASPLTQLFYRFHFGIPAGVIGHSYLTPVAWPARFLTRTCHSIENARCPAHPAPERRVSIQPDVDIIVSGAGASGLAATIALARAGFSVVCAGVSDTKPNGRTVALFEGSLRHLKAIGAWDRLEADAQPIRAIRMVDDTGVRIPVPPLTLEASEIGLAALGANVENDKLVAGLLAEAGGLPNVRLTGSFLTDIVTEAESVVARGADGVPITARLLVGADGKKSPARLAAGIGARAWTYKQVALTALLSHRKPHGGLSTEFHTRGGPCTLVPLRGSDEHPHRSSLVWLMEPREAERRLALDDAALAIELQHQTRSIVGRIALGPARGHFPMGGLKVSRLTAPRVVLMGEAAHAFPPLAAQGLNLSLRDIAQLVATLEAARREGADIGSLAALRPYERARRRDIALRTSGVDVLNRSIMTDFAPVDAARGVGAVALRLIGPLRRAVMREGILPPGPELRLGGGKVG